MGECQLESVSGGMFCVFVVYNLQIFCPRHNKMSQIISDEHLPWDIHDLIGCHSLNSISSDVFVYF